MDYKALERYARVVVEIGANVQPGQLVEIGGEVIHRDLAHELVKAAYARGARLVIVNLKDPRDTTARVNLSKSEYLTETPAYIQARYRELVDTNAVSIGICGEEFPGLYKDLDQHKLNTIRAANRKVAKYYYDEGIGKDKVHWCVIAGATPAWATSLFPGLPPQQALDTLWNQIFTLSRADHDDYAARWRAHSERLERRAQALNALQLQALQVTGPGTDLLVGLHERHRFNSPYSFSPRKVPFIANIPTEEVFTTPDYRMTRGKVRATKPFDISGVVVRDLHLEFVDGVITKFSASAGAEAFETYINSDPGGRRLGEVAIVGIDSPIFQSGLVFNEILFDENAACHIAVGSAYHSCIREGDTLQEAEYSLIGFNESVCHTDIMISDEQVDIVGIKRTDGARVPIVSKGQVVV